MSPFKENKIYPEKGQLYIWKTQNLEMVYTVSLTAQSRAKNMVLSPNNQFIAIEWLRDYDLFDCSQGKSVFHLSDLGFSYVLDSQRHMFSPDSKLIALHNIHNVIQIWDTQSLQMIHKIQTVDQGYYPAMAISPDSKLIATVTTNEHLSMFDLEAGVHLDQFKGSFHQPRYIYFFGNDRLLVSDCVAGTLSHQIQLLDAQTGAVLRVIKPGYWVSALHKLEIFLPIECIAIIDRIDHQKICEIWDLKIGTLKRRLEVPDGMKHFHLLPCTMHLRIDEAVVPLSMPDLSDCCSDIISFERLWIKRGDERLVFIPQDYASNLILLRDHKAIFHSFSRYDWERCATSKVFDTLDFDFSINEHFI